MSFQFYGGVHPDDKKSLTNEAAVTVLTPPSQIAVPMSLHIGAPCQPTVQVGDQVTHAKFGHGIIVDMDAKTVTVNFDAAGSKKLAKGIAPIKKV